MLGCGYINQKIQPTLNIAHSVHTTEVFFFQCTPIQKRARNIFPLFQSVVQAVLCVRYAFPGRRVERSARARHGERVARRRRGRQVAARRSCALARRPPTPSAFPGGRCGSQAPRRAGQLCNPPGACATRTAYPPRDKRPSAPREPRPTTRHARAARPVIPVPHPPTGNESR